MKSRKQIAFCVVTALGLGAAAAAFAHPEGAAHGMMMMHTMAGPAAAGDAAFRADMRLVHEMLQSHRKIGAR
jgi:hypothetical protein